MKDVILAFSQGAQQLNGWLPVKNTVIQFEPAPSFQLGIMKGGDIVPYIYSIITAITILTFNIGFSEYNISKKIQSHKFG